MSASSFALAAASKAASSSVALEALLSDPLESVIRPDDEDEDESTVSYRTEAHPTAMARMNQMIANTMPMMPHTLPAVVLPLLPLSFTAFDASTMATMPRTMPKMGNPLRTIARMPQTSAPVALPLLGWTGW